MDTTSHRESANQIELSGQPTEQKSYVRPTLYVYGKIDDLTEYVGIVNTDGPVGSSGAP
jgi:hypothetical protein